MSIFSRFQNINPNFFRIGLVSFIIILLCIELSLLIQVRSDNRMLDQIVQSNVNPDMNEREKIIHIMHWVHWKVSLINRSIKYEPELGKPDFLITPKQILTVGGACGNSTKLFVALVQRAKFKARPLLIISNGVIGAHVVAEVWVEGRWAIFDPIFGYFYSTPEGYLATAKHIQENPELLKKVVDRNYPIKSYSYQYITRTNWRKIPPILYTLLHKLLGEDKVQEIALNKYTVRPKILAAYLNIGLVAVVGMLWIILEYTTQLRFKIKRLIIKNCKPFNILVKD